MATSLGEKIPRSLALPRDDSLGGALPISVRRAGFRSGRQQRYRLPVRQRRNPIRNCQARLLHRPRLRLDPACRAPELRDEVGREPFFHEHIRVRRRGVRHCVRGGHYRQPLEPVVRHAQRRDQRRLPPAARPPPLVACAPRGRPLRDRSHGAPQREPLHQLRRGLPDRLAAGLRPDSPRTRAFPGDRVHPPPCSGVVDRVQHASVCRRPSAGDR